MKYANVEKKKSPSGNYPPGSYMQWTDLHMHVLIFIENVCAGENWANEGF